MPAANARNRVYWTLARPCARRTPRSEAEWTEAIHAALRLAVQKRIEIADVPVGVLLSGGLDSSLLVALLAEQGVRDLLTFSVGFEDQPGGTRQRVRILRPGGGRAIGPVTTSI
ncbi:MAG: asparagine synthase-related protein [Chromatiales bacterium]|nr:asparagine synthase-related protein [Chromatiales bacterium]